jgi:hypothetical protein
MEIASGYDFARDSCHARCELRRDLHAFAEPLSERVQA